MVMPQIKKKYRRNCRSQPTPTQYSWVLALIFLWILGWRQSLPGGRGWAEPPHHPFPRAVSKGHTQSRQQTDDNFLWQGVGDFVFGKCICILKNYHNIYANILMYFISVWQYRIHGKQYRIIRPAFANFFYSAAPDQ